MDREEAVEAEEVEAVTRGRTRTSASQSGPVTSDYSPRQSHRNITNKKLKRSIRFNKPHD